MGATPPPPHLGSPVHRELAAERRPKPRLPCAKGAVTRSVTEGLSVRFSDNPKTPSSNPCPVRFQNSRPAIHALISIAGGGRPPLLPPRTAFPRRRSEVCPNIRTEAGQRKGGRRVPAPSASLRSAPSSPIFRCPLAMSAPRLFRPKGKPIHALRVGLLFSEKHIFLLYAAL